MEQRGEDEKGIGGREGGNEGKKEEGKKEEGKKKKGEFVGRIRELGGESGRGVRRR